MTSSPTVQAPSTVRAAMLNRPAVIFETLTEGMPIEFKSTVVKENGGWVLAVIAGIDPDEKQKVYVTRPNGTSTWMLLKTLRYVPGGPHDTLARANMKVAREAAAARATAALQAQATAAGMTIPTEDAALSELQGMTPVPAEGLDPVAPAAAEDEAADITAGLDEPSTDKPEDKGRKNK